MTDKHQALRAAAKSIESKGCIHPMSQWNRWVNECSVDAVLALLADHDRMRAALSRSELKLRAYVGVCRDDKELTEELLPMIREALKECGR